MLISQKIFEKQFSSYNYKDSYLKAIKFASKYISENYTFKYEKQDDGKSIKLIVYFVFDEKDLASHRCQLCKEFHHSFFINEENNCNICKMKAYRAEIESRVKNLAKFQKDKF